VRVPPSFEGTPRAVPDNVGYKLNGGYFQFADA
jgi:hypothetical protein